MVNEDDYCGLFSDSKAFRKFFEEYCISHRIPKDDRWWRRDWLVGCWNAALDNAVGLELTKEEKRIRAYKLDESRISDEYKIVYIDGKRHIQFKKDK